MSWVPNARRNRCGNRLCEEDSIRDFAGGKAYEEELLAAGTLELPEERASLR